MDRRWSVGCYRYTGRPEMFRHKLYGLHGLGLRTMQSFQRGLRWNSNVGRKEKVSITLNEKDLLEKFVRGSGPGGQAVNKTNNCVQLTHIPTGILVSSHESRELSTNRKIARKKLIDQLDLVVNGKDSQIARKERRKQRRKAKSRR